MTVGFGAVSILRSAKVKYDFSHFYLDAQHLWQNGEINTRDDLDEKEGGPHLPWYLPLAAILFVPIAAIGEPTIAGIVWFAVSWGAMIATVRWFGRELTSLPPRDWLITQAPALILCGGAIFANCHFNQISFVVLAAVAGSFALLRRRRPWLAGMVLSAAALVKLLPAVFLLWWVLRRRWRAIGGFLFGVVCLDIVLNVAIFGVSRTWEYHERWFRNSVVHGSTASMILRGDENDYRNQGLGVVMLRLLSAHEPGRTTVITPSGQEVRRQVTRINLTNLSRRSVVAVYIGVSVVSVFLLAWAIHRTEPKKLPPPDVDTDWNDRLIFALMCLAMLWFSPLVRQYYLIWCYPAISLLLACRELHGRAGRGRSLINLSLFGWLVSQFCWLVPELRSAGVNLWAVLLLALAVAVEIYRESPANPSPPPFQRQAVQSEDTGVTTD
jgi:hypothetical protein